MFPAFSQLKRQEDIKVDTDGKRIFDIAVVSDIRLLVTVNYKKGDSGEQSDRWDSS